MPEQSAPKTARNPVTILADWLSGYVGDDKPQDAYLPYAEQIIGWLSDEGWRIVRDEPPSDIDQIRVDLERFRDSLKEEPPIYDAEAVTQRIRAHLYGSPHGRCVED